MSANLIVDLGSTALPSTSGNPNVSIASTAGVGGTPASGIIIGQIIDCLQVDTYCNLFAAGASVSGQFKVAVQTSDATTSGSFTDPTSGLPQMPTSFLSGGVAVFNSGNNQMCSGGIAFAAFQNPSRYVRAVVLSGDQFNGNVTVGFVAQLRTTGSGGGFTMAPSSGVVNV